MKNTSKENLLTQRAHIAFINFDHRSDKGWESHPEGFIINCQDCQKFIIANLQTFELYGTAHYHICPEPPPRT